MRYARLALIAACAATLLSGSALAQGEASLSAPQGLKPFLLRADESPRHAFPRTPSFSWAPVRGASRYEFQLAKSPDFDESSVLYSTSLKSPAVTIPMALPWMSGNPYAAYGRVRARTGAGVTAWTKPFGFNVEWDTLPEAILSAQPGLARWTPVPGATSYHVWFTDIGKVVATRTNAVDEREFYAFHRVPSFIGSVHWRVRAVRTMYGTIPSNLPRVTYGPWSKVNTSKNTTPSSGPLKLVSAVSDDGTESTAAVARAHRLTPAFTFSGDQVGSASYTLFRVYVFSDSKCVNVIYRGAITGGPSYAPRTTGPLALPQSAQDVLDAASTYLPDGQEGKTFMADTASVQTTESDRPAAAAAAKPTKSGSTVGTGSTDPLPGADLALPSLPALTGAPVDLWDSGWPHGRFYWTVIPVVATIASSKSTILTGGGTQGSASITVASIAGISKGSALTVGAGESAELALVESVTGSIVTLSSPLTRSHGSGEKVSQGTQVEYRDAELPQDACSNGRVMAFGKQSSPVVAGGSTAFASGLSPNGRLVASVNQKTAFFGAPLVAWKPALGADGYQVEWSKKAYPWKAAGSLATQSTSALLPLKAGGWFYRVRGVNALLPGSAKAMSWSAPQRLTLARPVFRVAGN